MPRRQTWTDDDLRRAVASSTSIKMTMLEMGVRPGGGVHYNVVARVKQLGIDTSHFVVQPKALWTDEQLRLNVPLADGYVSLLARLALSPTAALYERIKRRIRMLGIDTSHFSRKRGPRGVRQTRWTEKQLRVAVAESFSVAQTLRRLGLVAAGGNYVIVQRRIRDLSIDTTHFTGKGWNVGPRARATALTTALDDLLVADRWTSSHKLKQRLLKAGLKAGACELCGWAERASDGRIPLELDHINGDRNDNRLENLRILCPNCHALQPTHRGLNQKRRRRS